MKIAIDKNSISALDNKNEFIYLFDDENINDLIKTNLHCIYYKNCDYVDINLSKYNVSCLKKADIKDKNCKKSLIKKDYKIGIIIPNFNYEHTLKKCLESILKQTYKKYEIIFIDDCSTDNSVKIAKSLLRKPHKIIELKQKRYNGGSRNEAYLYLSNDVDYVWYVDSDDWLLDDTVLQKINNNLQNFPDVLFIGLSQYKNNKTTPVIIPQYNSKYDAIKGWSGSSGKVIKKNLATRQECLYNEGTLKEDRNQHCRICIYMDTFAILKEPLYVWNRDNSKSITTIRDKILWGTSTIRHYADTLQLQLSVEGKDLEIDKYLKERVRQTKMEIDTGGDKQW